MAPGGSPNHGHLPGGNSTSLLQGHRCKHRLGVHHGPKWHSCPLTRAAPHHLQVSSSSSLHCAHILLPLPLLLLSTTSLLILMAPRHLGVWGHLRSVVPCPFTGQGTSQLCAVHPEPVVPDCGLFQTYSLNQVLGSRARLFSGMVFLLVPRVHFF